MVFAERIDGMQVFISVSHISSFNDIQPDLMISQHHMQNGLAVERF
jgi:hypothetical protein